VYSTRISSLLHLNKTVRVFIILLSHSKSLKSDKRLAAYSIVWIVLVSIVHAPDLLQMMNFAEKKLSDYK
jgi:hypothetical protein